MGWFTEKQATSSPKESASGAPSIDYTELNKLRREKARAETEEKGRVAFADFPKFGSLAECEMCGSGSVVRTYEREHSIALTEADEQQPPVDIYSWVNHYTRPTVYRSVIAAMRCVCGDCGYKLGYELTKKPVEPTITSRWPLYSVPMFGL